MNSFVSLISYPNTLRSYMHQNQVYLRTYLQSFVHTDSCRSQYGVSVECISW